MNKPIAVPDALIGYTGFVGSTLLKQRWFDLVYNSRNITEIAGSRFGLLVCAGAPAQKWIANREPEVDLKNIEQLISQLSTIRCDRFVLISTVDVFSMPIAVDEETEVDLTNLHAYGRHRRMLEKYVAESMPCRSLIVRLPGLVGPGLRKNAIYDLHHSNNTSAIDSRAIYQFYPMVNLWPDIQVALKNELRLVHLTAAPVSIELIARKGFGLSFENQLSNTPAQYDFRSRYAPLFGGRDGYQYDERETLLAVRHYAQSEPHPA